MIIHSSLAIPTIASSQLTVYASATYPQYAMVHGICVGAVTLSLSSQGLQRMDVLVLYKHQNTLAFYFTTSYCIINWLIPYRNLLYT